MVPFTLFVDTYINLAGKIRLPLINRRVCILFSSLLSRLQQGVEI